MGTRAYLSCTPNEELVEGHCLIVPIQHHLTSLEADDDVWDEIRVSLHCSRHDQSYSSELLELHEVPHADVRGA